MYCSLVVNVYNVTFVTAQSVKSNPFKSYPPVLTLFMSLKMKLVSSSLVRYLCPEGGAQVKFAVAEEVIISHFKMGK